MNRLGSLQRCFVQTWHKADPHIRSLREPRPIAVRLAPYAFTFNLAALAIDEVNVVLPG